MCLPKKKKDFTCGLGFLGPKWAHITMANSAHLRPSNSSFVQKQRQRHFHFQTGDRTQLSCLEYRSLTHSLTGNHYSLRFRSFSSLFDLPWRLLLQSPPLSHASLFSVSLPSLTLSLLLHCLHCHSTSQTPNPRSPIPIPCLCDSLSLFV